MKLVHLMIEAERANIIKAGRRKGNTTRMVDLAIQLLFEGNTVIIEDHYLKSDALHIYGRIVDRLTFEHFHSTTRYEEYVVNGGAPGVDGTYRPTLKLNL